MNITVTKIRDQALATVRLIWNKLPKIALYTVALWAIFLVIGGVTQAIDKRNDELAPASEFLSYTSFTVQNAREGEDVTFTLCRQHKENYSVAGTRTVYVIPEGKQEADKVFIYNKDIKGVVDTGNCQPYFIKASEYHFKPGKYLITLNLNFKVKYDIPKSVFTKSGVFTIYPQPKGTTDVQAQLNILQQQLRDQQQIIDQLISSGTVRTPTSTGNSGDGGDSQPTSVTNNNTTINTDPDRAAPEPKPRYEERCDPLVNALGIRIGEINCRQVRVE